MPLFVDDFLGGTALWGGKERGLYALLLIMQWAGGPLPADPATLARVVGYELEAFRGVWKTVAAKFESTPQGLVNRRLEEHRAVSLELKRDRSDAGKAGADARWHSKGIGKGNGKRMPRAMANDMANGMAKSCPPTPTPTPTPSPSPSGKKTPSRASALLSVFRDPEWSKFKRDYPRRAGAQPWERAAKAWQARIREGHTPAEMLAGVERYKAYLRAGDGDGTRWVLAAANFIGTEKHFQNPWDPPPTKAAARLAGNLSAKDEAMRLTERKHD
jgi:uncharacterized protein YdaU (DUF1376 family)